MRYVLLFLVLLIVTSLLYKYLLADDDPITYTAALQKQATVFTASNDSAAIIWQRAKDYLNKNASLLGGGQLQQNDSLLYLPYYNQHKKGNSIRIEKQTLADAASFRVQWWYSQALQQNGSRQLALYMQQGNKKEYFK